MAGKEALMRLVLMPLELLRHYELIFFYCDFILAFVLAFRKGIVRPPERNEASIFFFIH